MSKGITWQFVVPENELAATGYEYQAGSIYSLALRYQNASQGDQGARDAVVAQIADIVEDIGIFPITYFSLRGARAEILECMAVEPAYGFQRETDVVNAGVSAAGVDLCRWMFPNLHATVATSDGVSLLEKFSDRKRLEKAIQWACSGPRPQNTKKAISAGWLYAGLRGGGAAPTNFPPMAAKAIFERFTPMNGVIWDPSAGFGGRLLGAMTSKNGYTYIGTDPEPETIEHLRQLGAIVESVTGRPYSFEVHEIGSEDYVERCEDVDFVFTSPPYFDLEDYGQHGDQAAYQRQSHIRYPTPEEWVQGYLRGTVRNIYRALKPGAWCVINVADTMMAKDDRGRPTDYVDDWVEISEEEGLLLRRRGSYAVKARPGTEHQATGRFDEMAQRVKGRRREPLLIFQKPRRY
ncbi:MAG: site-specific DNA-methyltransferase [Yaniella sp.]|nr:site-specific DNA-methyltransferase [Yaniella sp.]